MTYSPTTIERFDDTEALGRYLLEELRRIGAELTLVEQGRYMPALGTPPPKPREGVISVSAQAVLGADAGLYEYQGNEWRKLAQAYGFKAPTSITLNTGTGTGSVADLQTMLDGNVYHIDEAAGTPGFALDVNFTGVARIRGLQVRFQYLGSATHWVQVEMWNYVASAWDAIFTTNTMEGYTTRLALFPSGANYFDGGGNAKVRFYHVSAGNASHDIDIDFVGVIV
jgi:hypothetical protein